MTELNRISKPVRFAFFVKSTLEMFSWLTLLVSFTYLLIFKTQDLADFSRFLSTQVLILVLAFMFRNPLIKLVNEVAEFTVTKGTFNYKSKTSQDIQNKSANEALEKIASEKDNKSDIDTWSREDIEKFIKVSASWGFSMAKIGFQTPPIPVVVWDGTIPTISFGTGSPLAPVENDSEMNFLIQKITETESEIDLLGPFDRMSTGISPSKYEAKQKTLSRLKTKLKLLDPNSPFAS
jgi:hypothetical protein